MSTTHVTLTTAVKASTNYTTAAHETFLSHARRLTRAYRTPVCDRATRTANVYILLSQTTHSFSNRRFGVLGERRLERLRRMSLRLDKARSDARFVTPASEVDRSATKFTTLQNLSTSIGAGTGRQRPLSILGEWCRHTGYGLGYTGFPQPNLFSCLVLSRWVRSLLDICVSSVLTTPTLHSSSSSTPALLIVYGGLRSKSAATLNVSLSDPDDLDISRIILCTYRRCHVGAKVKESYSGMKPSHLQTTMKLLR